MIAHSDTCQGLITAGGFKNTRVSCVLRIHGFPDNTNCLPLKELCVDVLWLQDERLSLSRGTAQLANVEDKRKQLFENLKEKVRATYVQFGCLRNGVKDDNFTIKTCIAACCLQKNSIQVPMSLNRATSTFQHEN